MHKGKICPAHYPESKLYNVKRNFRKMVLYYISCFWSDSSFCSCTTNTESRNLSNIQLVWNLHCKPQFQSSQSRFADGLVLLFVPYSARYPSSLYSTSNIFHTVAAQQSEQPLKLISIQNRDQHTILRDNFYGERESKCHLQDEH